MATEDKEFKDPWYEIATPGPSRVPYLTGKIPEEVTQEEPPKDVTFKPRFPETAKHESGILRTKAVPYAVGAVPSAKNDPGKQSYGTYQIRTQEMPNFVDSLPDGEKYKQLKSLLKSHGVGTPAFNAEYKKVAAKYNKDFGELQESFRVDVGSDAQKSVIKHLGIREFYVYPDRFMDFMFGFVNQYGAGLAPKVAKTMGANMKAAAKKKGSPLSMNEIVGVMSDYKLKNVKSNFNKVFKKGGEPALDNLRARFRREQSQFQDPKKDFHPDPAVDSGSSFLNTVEAALSRGESHRRIEEPLTKHLEVIYKRASKKK